MLRGSEGPTEGAAEVAAEKGRLQRKEEALMTEKTVLQRKEEALMTEKTALQSKLDDMDATFDELCETAARCTSVGEKERIVRRQQQLSGKIEDMRQERRACVERLKENSMQLTSVTRQLEALQTAPSSRGEFLQYIYVSLLSMFWAILCRALRTGSCAVSL